MTDAEQLKPCPFCGERLEVSDTLSFRSNLIYVHPSREGEPCIAQSIGIWAKSEDRIAAWNRRPNPSGDADVREKIIAAIREPIEADGNAKCGGTDFEDSEQTVYSFVDIGRLDLGSIANAILALTGTQQAKGEGWRSDMENAPRDGTTIDVWRAEGGRETVFWGKPHHDCGEAGSYCDSDWHSIRAPGWVCNTFDQLVGRKHNPFTHWKSLDSGPVAALRSNPESPA